MCGRFTSTSSVEDLVAAFDVDQVRIDEPPERRWNVAPTQPVLAVAARRPDPAAGRDPARLLGTYRWGLVPSWAKDPKVGSSMINARAEGIGDRPAYRKALLRRRCVIPADAFYEWQARPSVKAKQPWAIARADGRPMALAGLWELWRDRHDPDAEPLRTCVIVTTAASEQLAAIHDRMPVVLDGEALDRWLDPTLEDRGEIESVLEAAAATLFDTWPVTTRVNAVANEGPELVEVAPPPD